MNDTDEGLTLSQQIARKIAEDLVEKNLLQKDQITPSLLESIALGEMNSEDWKSEFERSADSINQQTR